MQKDVHFYLTYALARKAGLNVDTAKRIAWADQYTDEMTKPDVHGIQTQSDVLGDWDHRQIQLSVLAPFHFIPGDDATRPWMTTRNSPRARSLVKAAACNLFQLGIALHALQDTFSHEKFSGWREKGNRCFPWYYLQTHIPNVGHAEMAATPDIAHRVWQDPRDNRIIDNKLRVLAAANATYHGLLENLGLTPLAPWTPIKNQIKEFVKQGYDQRITNICKFSGDTKLHYKTTNQKLEAASVPEFAQAASRHLSAAMDSFSSLPWKP
ncbi:MAG TPA: DUF6765 family protein [Candidatus Bathyarchaeia archaeon]|nr:DUF6765 family protein [Candidatus Bathyarchaeia archaeon]